MERRLYETGVGRTVGAQTITLCAIVLPADSFAILEMKVGGLSIDGLAGGATRSSAVKRVAGAYALIGDFLATNLKGDAGLAGVVIAPVVNGNAIELQITGIAGKTIDWSGALLGQLHVTGQ